MTLTLSGELNATRTTGQYNINVSTDALAPGAASRRRGLMRVETTAHRYSEHAEHHSSDWAARSAQAAITYDPDCWVISLGVTYQGAPLHLSAEDLTDAMTGLNATGISVVIHRVKTAGQTPRHWTVLRREVIGRHLIETYYAPGPLPLGPFTLRLHAALHRRAGALQGTDRPHTQALHEALDEALLLTREQDRT